MALRRISLPVARRIAVVATGLASPRPTGRVDVRHLRRMFSQIQVLQIDSVNVVQRAHHLTTFARLGAHDTGIVARAQENRELFEYWGHASSLLPMEDWPLFQFRMERARPGPRSTRLMEEDPGYLDAVLDEVREHGPLTASDLSDPGERAGPWWGWSKGKVALEWLFTTGLVTVANRRNFTRHYDVPERVVPAEILHRPPVPAEDALRLLVERAARALGVATVADLADYFRINVAETAMAAKALAADGTLQAVEVEGWAGTSYRHRAVPVPRETVARSLVCPFDPIVWFRPRTERLFGFHYRIEIYTPEPKRQFGYYVFPFLLGERLVGRVDIKADRTAGILRVPGAFVEAGEDPAALAVPLAAELQEMTGWLGLGEIAVGRKGTLATSLRRIL